MPTGVYTRTIEHLNKLSQTQKQRLSSPEERKKISDRCKRLGVGKWMKGKKASDETRKKISESNKGKHRESPSKETIEKQRAKLLGRKRSVAFRKKQSLAQKRRLLAGTHNFWKGGISSKNKQIRGSLEYRLWREKVFARDNWTCVWCHRKGLKINADHVWPFSKYPALRFDTDNGRTLCLDCHKKTQTYQHKLKTWIPIHV